jgi:hypothetical protein
VHISITFIFEYILRQIVISEYVSLKTKIGYHLSKTVLGGFLGSWVQWEKYSWPGPGEENSWTTLNKTFESSAAGVRVSTNTTKNLCHFCHKVEEKK